MDVGLALLLMLAGAVLIGRWHARHTRRTARDWIRRLIRERE